GETRRGLCHLSAADFVGHFRSVEEHPILQSGSFLLRCWWFQLNMRLASKPFEAGIVIERNCVPQCLQRYSSVHCTAVEIQITEHRRHPTRNAALPGSCRSIDGNRELGHLSSTGTFACAVSTPLQPSLFPLNRCQSEVKQARMLAL